MVLINPRRENVRCPKGLPSVSSLKAFVGPGELRLQGLSDLSEVLRSERKTGEACPLDRPKPTLLEP